MKKNKNKNKNENEIIINPSSIKHNQNHYISYKKQYESLIILFYWYVSY